MINKTSVIDKNAKLGKDIKIGPFCFVGPNVQIGDGVELLSNIHIEGNTKIGKGTKIFPFASIGTQPQDLKYAGEKNSIEIGENNTIREYVTINPGTKSGGGKTNHTITPDCSNLPTTTALFQLGLSFSFFNNF